jgi:hypothetical protein
MPEQELLGVDQDPAQVLDGLAAVGGGQVLDGGGQLGRVRLAGQGDEVELQGDLLGRLATLEVLEFRARRRPPLWATLPSGLRRIRLVSAARGLIRRPPASRLRVKKSWSGR